MKSSIPGIDEKYGSAICALFKNFPQVESAVLFGSRAKGNFREGSDIDIALKGKAVTLVHRGQIQEAYEVLYLPWKLDLILYDSITEAAVKDHIDRLGIALPI